MTAITTLLFPEPTLQRSPGAVIGWWERRRPLYNAAVGATGVVTISLLAVALGPAMFLQPGTWIGVTAYGIAADRKSTRLNSSHRCISYAVFCLKKKKKIKK